MANTIKIGSMDIQISTDLSSYDSFWDWFIHFRNPFNKENGHFYWEPTFFANELEIYLLGLLTFVHAYRHGWRYVWLWCAIMFHGYTVELVSYFFEPIDNFWHAWPTILWFGRREANQIVLVYPAYLYISSMVVERLGVSELTQACTLALMVVILDFPYDIMGIKLLWWTWHDTDSNLFDRNYWVPITSYYFHATFACAFSLIYNKARRYFVGISGLYGRDELHFHASYGRREKLASDWVQEFKACASAGLFSMPFGILQFIPNFHYFRDVWKIHAEVTMIALGAIYLLVMFFGVNRARPVNLLEEGEREQRKGDKKLSSGGWYYDEIVMCALIHFGFYICIILFASPETYQVYGLHQTMGSAPGSGDEFDCLQTRNVTYPYPFTLGYGDGMPLSSVFKKDWFQNVTITKRPYLCPGGYLMDEGVFNFNCEMAKKQEWVPGKKFYWICGTDYENDGKGARTSYAEYLFVIISCCVLGAHAIIQPLIYPRTLYKQFVVLREFPKYWKYDKPPSHSISNVDQVGGTIVDTRVNDATGKFEVGLKRNGAHAIDWVEREAFVSMSVGPIYAERGGLYGVHHDSHNKSSLERLQRFNEWKNATQKVNKLNKSRSKSPAYSFKGIDYSSGVPKPKR